ncbi:hypothetical protein FRB95_010656 [Tulasnella sp. JGI-2019a]|nr:hypothetical protein FRB95_010656 [Tulasnella sp. JGI-2019a]
MGKEPRATPRVVSVAIPIFRAGGKILLVTSRKRSDKWVCECCSSALFLAVDAGNLPPPMSDILFMTAVDFVSVLPRVEKRSKKVIPPFPLPRDRVALPPLSSPLASRVSRLGIRYFNIIVFGPFSAGVRGTISRFVVTIPLPNTIYHVYEMEVTTVEDDWLERKERTREWMDFSEAARRLAWKPELLQGLMLSTLAPKR